MGSDFEGEDSEATLSNSVWKDIANHLLDFLKDEENIIRRFSNADCDVKLKDTVLDWEITPACNLPLKCLRGGEKIVIVNL
ncbi:hypothetical protein L2E82_13414 [Cichorium intybus]|uniref:Uncharacterized protein n=1 Tax=Cichorium intybus TaxID=13427 RepID=A0ACB9EXE1_CICIN|nr:hypothetical protein L2E82_13414 [Cichorium intybus]